MNRKWTVWMKRCAGVFMGVVLVCTGCTMDIPLSVNGPAAPDVVSADVATTDATGSGGAFPLGCKATLGVDTLFVKADVDESVTTVPVHPDDASFLTGATSTTPNDGYFGNHGVNVAPVGGLFVTAGTPRFNLYLGGYGRWNWLHYADGTRAGVYSTRQQVSDVRPANDGSFVFTQVTPGAVSLIPAAGVETQLGDCRLGLEVGFPHTRWTARSGHDRWAQWETVNRESWSGFGIRYAARASWQVSDSSSLFVSGAYESYDCNFGDVSGVAVMVGGEVRR